MSTMSPNKLAHEAILHALECKQEPGSVEQIEKLTFREYLYLLSQARYFLDIHVHPERLAAAIERARRRAQEDDLADELIRHHAHGAMMEALFGMTPAEVARRRRTLGVARDPGRPRRLQPEQADAVWRSWKQHHGLPGPERYLRVAQRCRVPAQAVWQLVQEADSIQREYAARRQGVPAVEEGR
ncbi:STY4526/YPO1902 family pathogenicity island replication protein [Halorhodospira halophila]|uniref:DUF2857 domain-containing protein n=1 Tax=Halorhodospira halophila (strain DSM 244 / SL1) TaxID=349124 RepID=A1WUR2_HALHL|nr:STY4526/YPO1902 family pathogenicity island replication protein [Halorhodospira halophila]ABM61424.1 hypothetical protein Hhal_0640 [Halorhodospira halophila SL1]